MTTGSEPIKIDDTSTPERFLQIARERYRFASDFWEPNYRDALDDLKFTYQDQWGDDVRRERAGRPTVTLNKLPSFIDQVVGDQRQNKSTIVVHPVEADKPQQKQDGQNAQTAKVKNLAGTRDYTEAEIRNGQIRNIEQVSSADNHYDTAFQHAVEGPIGWLRVITAYAQEDTFDQELFIRSVKNRFSVLIDPQAVDDPDLSCAQFCFISEMMRRKEFDVRYPDATISGLPSTIPEPYQNWYTEKMVRVAEYFWREPVTRTLLLLSDGKTVFEDKVKDVLDDMQRQGIVPIRTRKVKTYKVMWAKITGMSILEKPQEVPFDTIPVVPVCGKQVMIGDTVHYRGLVRYGKDAQVMHNYMWSAAIERVGLSPKAPYIADAKSIEGYKNDWETANIKNVSVLRYNHRTDIPAPRREQPPSMPSAELNLAMSAVDEIKSTIGLFDASLGQQGNETSGKAILARQRQGDRGTFSFIDNLNRAKQRIGKLLLYAIPEVYDTERTIRLMFEDGSGDWVKINESILDHQTGRVVQIHDIASGKFDCTVSTGPSYQTQRMEAADSLMSFMQVVPQSASVILDLVAKNMDWPGAQEISKRLKKVLPPNILSEQEKQEEGIDNSQPTPADQLNMEKIKVEMAQAQSNMALAEANKQTAQAKALEAQVKLEELKMAAQLANPANMANAVRNLVAESLAEIMVKTQGQQQGVPPGQQQGVPPGQQQGVPPGQQPGQRPPQPQTDSNQPPPPQIDQREQFAQGQPMPQ